MTFVSRRSEKQQHAELQSQCFLLKNPGVQMYLYLGL